MQQTTPAAIHLKPWKPQPFMPVSSQVYSEIQQFLVYEALLLDHRCFDQWSALLARDVTYSVCNCSGHDARGLDPAEYVASGRDSLLSLVRHRCRERDVRPDDSLPLTRRFVTNVSVSFAHCRNEYEVVSYLQVTRIGHEGTADSAWSAERRDRLRGTDRAFAISHREVLIDSIHSGATGLPAFL
jgi:3-phenylpropionate/cinnamic acid dioxygenase small subunit